MGNRQALLDAARVGLSDKGYARITARDIATAAGVSLAAIGYHFGSKEALLDAALVEALRDWGDALESIAAAAPASASPRERFVAVWDRVSASIAADRSLWAVQFELLSAAARDPERAQAIAESNRHARLALVELFGVAGDASTGALLQMLLTGAVARLLLDPADAVAGEDLLSQWDGLRGGL
ncbi:MAG TPA: helix-turn-helix domain-containing protein [Stackebrandtia sp.]|jgi:AcrR family transcriptional regulator|uniref:TetR/AcrR family transcriptional regulator n=1 Tax=Stackebrandtia sp. TaxID=2023065 RepID=UPI002D3F2F5F|nr:helix-turn-helix domain-containing protein [Stackebrandtia sp.]HZE37369.1 helix-turn-helix domain-containing protein [Stackebrandtia sp.]